MKVLAIDPGDTESAVVIWTGQRFLLSKILPNEALLKFLRGESNPSLYDMHVDTYALEMVASYGMPVGRTVFDTVLWIGRFYEAIEEREGRVLLTYRQAVKMHHCNSVRAKDSNIRQALIDKYGKPGTKKAPGVTYGLKTDLWQAFALATFHTEARNNP